MRVYLKIGVLAFVAMVAQDALSTCMVVFEAHYNAPLAALFDSLNWFAWLASSGLAVQTIVKEGLWTRKAAVIIASITAANVVGTLAGVAMARHLA